jgi:tmRNA-binding protein
LLLHLLLRALARGNQKGDRREKREKREKREQNAKMNKTYPAAPGTG